MRNRNYIFLLSNLVLKDFRIRYRNMSLGILWSLVNPLVMMGVLTFVFTKIRPNDIGPHNYAVFVLCALVPFNFYTIAFATGTTSVIENYHLIKRVRFPREVIPVASVLSNCLHFLVQIALLIGFVLAFGYGMNRYWLWLPVVWGLEIAFVCGLTLISSSLDVYLRDVRYVVESSNLVMFWLVPIFYSFGSIPKQFELVYNLNPISAVVFASRNVLLEGRSPAASLLWNLAAVSLAVLALGMLVFGRLKRRFADYL
ncbi:MAG: ABC transporter permease [Acidobacteria bacterium]|nr:ABC transporter permease [Acidobacteriota bacterium]MBI3471086.1 ABC transporter permease [Candidatus Solibacter usitatus]